MNRMQDRQPKYPNRYAAVPVPGADNVYDIYRADEPIDPGTPLNKASFLKDATATALGFSNPKSALPDDAFRVLNATYGTCGTAAGTAAKVVVCPNFILKTGARVAVRFSATNTANNPTLNVNGAGAIAIARYSTTAPFPYMWQAGSVVEFFYDGTRWIMTGGTTATTTYYGPTILYDGIDSTSTTMAATANSVKQAVAQAESSIIDKAAGTATFTAKSPISVGDIVNIDGNYASKDIRYSAENSTVQNDISIGYLLSNTKAVSVKSASARTVQIQTIGATTVSNGSTSTLNIPEDALPGSVYRVFPIDSTSFLYFIGRYYSEEDSSGYSWTCAGYGYISRSSIYSFGSTWSLYGAHFVDSNNYLPVPGKKILYGLDTSSDYISKITVNTSASQITHSSMYPYWTNYSTHNTTFLCVLPNETMVVCSEQETSSSSNRRYIRILDPSVNTSGGPYGSAKIVSSSGDLTPNSSIANKSTMKAIAVTNTLFLTVFDDQSFVFTTRSGTTLTNGDSFKPITEKINDVYQGVILQHLSDTQALIITTDIYKTKRYRIVNSNKTISEPTVIEPPEPTDGNPFTSFGAQSGYGNMFLKLERKEGSAYKYSLAKMRETNYSKDAIAMTSASTNGTVKVCMEGNMALSSAKRGQYIKSVDGEPVAYSYTNGMINVIPPWNRAARELPIGVILNWRGSISDIPKGWALCNGENGTPDLTDKFVLAAGGDKNPGDKQEASTGGTTVNTVGIVSSVITTSRSATQVGTSVGSKNSLVPYYALAYIMKV